MSTTTVTTTTTVITTTTTTTQTRCRDLTVCFTNGQLIKHTINMPNGTPHTWFGVYSRDENEIVCNGVRYKGRSSPLNKFAKTHYEIARPDRVSNVNAWKECEYQGYDGNWESTYNL